MRKATLDDISFDKEDALLFSYSDNLLLKAKNSEQHPAEIAGAVAGIHLAYTENLRD